MPEIVISIRNKTPEASVRSIVCDNTDYTVRLDCDGDWGEGPKMVFFALQGVGAFAPVMTEDDVCSLPMIHLSDGVGRQLAVGVQQGRVKTSRPVCLYCYPSAESEFLNGIHEDEEVTLSWLQWVNANMAAAETNVETAQNVLAQAQAAAESAEQSAESAAIDAAAARISAQTTAFPVFSVDERGHVIISRAERLGTTTFRLNSAGHLEVTA